MKDFLIDSLLNLESYNKLLENIGSKVSPIATYGIVDENLGHFCYALREHTDKQMLIITYDDLRSRMIYEDIKNLGLNNIELFPKREIILYDVAAYSFENSYQRIKVLSDLINGKNKIIVTSIGALLDKIMIPSVFNTYTQEVETGSEINLDDFTKILIDAGYERVPMIEAKGQFSIRGGIIDFFPPDSLNPYRVELFDDEVDSIRTFELDTQRSIDIVKKAIIPPVNELIISEDIRGIIKKNIVHDLEKFIKKDKDSEHKKAVKEKFENYITQLNEGIGINNRDLLIPYIPKDQMTDLLSYLEKDALVFIDEPRRLTESHKNHKEDFNIRYTDLLEAGELLPSHIDIFFDFQDIVQSVNSKTCITNSALLTGDNNFNPKAIVNFTSKSMSSYHSKLELLKDDLNHYRYRGYKIIILSGNEDRGKRLKDSLFNLGVESSFYAQRDEDIKSGQIFITPGSLKGGFEYSQLKLVVISDKEIFGAGKTKKAKTSKKSKDKPLAYSDLKIGDYVVHENYGIGQYEGIIQLEIQGIKKDFISIQYKGKDKLYLPIDQMTMIQKYIGADAIKPKINKLSSGEWAKVKIKAKKAVDEMAYDLIELYAKREKLTGYAFSPDNTWQNEFEDLFPYEETEGQLRSIEEIKKDMQIPKPMDRLLCGDVGYGKTEVALRAAFKALVEGKQVAILVPTTILAQQHYNTAVDRLSNFPMTISLLSRFRNANEIKATVEGLKKGTVDLVIGTHRLLSKDIKFKDLGLLIVDEEQRFGVKHKEALKKFKENIDVLTLTATPIPRTLHMSLAGIRDMSVIEDPPEERFPVQSYVVEFNPSMIRDAILREINRDGQVYFVYNRVETIDRVAAQLSQLVPEAKFSVGHGQMGERQLENVMLDFLNKKHDVLICTTIIETGLDIPNVNTIIIYDADKMGLSQLYQLRGRVGRSNRLAYGYFTFARDKVLSEVAERRLRAIKEFTEFGSGFKIAMRDLEIRGAGNLLGVAQHGHMESIGYDLYVKYLSQAIRKLKGEIIAETIETTIDIKVDGFIPRRYIHDEEQRIQIYKKIASVENWDDYSELIDELIDRFGDVPKEVENLMQISYIRSLANRVDVKNILHNSNNNVKMEFASTEKITLELINYISKKYGNKITFDLSNNPSFTIKTKDVLLELKEFFIDINEFVKK